MKLTINHQEHFSRGELLLRQFFGFFYIIIPHYFLLFFVGIWSNILAFITWWIILFTGTYPKSFFDFQVGVTKWQIRVSSRLMNLADGYPSFGVGGTDEYTDFQMEHPESLSRGLLLVKTFFGFIYVMIPHGFCLIFRGIGSGFLAFLAFWAVLFTGHYPESWHRFNTGTIRWQTRVNLYMGLWMTDEYPPFSGKEFEEHTIPAEVTAPAEPTE
jgi:hypothetical protein